MRRLPGDTPYGAVSRAPTTPSSRCIVRDPATIHRVSVSDGKRYDLSWRAFAMQQTHQQNISDHHTHRPIVLRPLGAERFIGALPVVAMVAVTVALVLHVPSQVNASILSATACVTAIFLAFSIYYQGAHVTATAEGLTWRYFLRTHHAVWADVREYYEVPWYPSQRSTSTTVRKSFHIETASGVCCTLPQFSGDIPAFQACVRQCATAARTTDWHVRETHPTSA